MTKEEFKGLCLSSKAHRWLTDLRIVPRAMVLGYGYVIWESYSWVSSLDVISTTQAAFVSTIWAAAAAWFAFYVNSGNSED